MYVPHGSAGGERSPAIGGDESPRTVEPFEHYSCGVCSLLLTAVFALLFYPLLVSMTLPLGILTTTAILSTVVLVWGLGWIGFELLWEWRAGRLFASRPS